MLTQTKKCRPGSTDPISGAAMFFNTFIMLGILLVKFTVVCLSTCLVIGFVLWVARVITDGIESIDR